MANLEFLIKGSEDVLDERLRQIDEQKLGAEADATLAPGDRAAAGACLAIFAAWHRHPSSKNKVLNGTPVWWPKDKLEWSPSSDMRANLVKAAALLINEIDAIDRENSSVDAKTAD